MLIKLFQKWHLTLGRENNENWRTDNETTASIASWIHSLCLQTGLYRSWHSFLIGRTCVCVKTVHNYLGLTVQTYVYNTYWTINANFFTGECDSHDSVLSIGYCKNQTSRLVRLFLLRGIGVGELSHKKWQEWLSGTPRRYQNVVLFVCLRYIFSPRKTNNS